MENNFSIGNLNISYKFPGLISDKLKITDYVISKKICYLPTR